MGAANSRPVPTGVAPSRLGSQNKRIFGNVGSVVVHNWLPPKIAEK